MGEYITLDEVKKLWTIPGKKPPSTTTIWARRRAGLDNLYKKDDVIRMRDEYFAK